MPSFASKRSPATSFAYIRFASVYRQFKDVAQFLSAITEIVKK